MSKIADKRIHKREKSFGDTSIAKGLSDCGKAFGNNSEIEVNLLSSQIAVAIAVKQKNFYLM